MTEATRDPEAIEQDIRQTQDDMSRTVERISDQLSVQNLLGSVFGTGDGGSPDTRKLVEAGKRNPVALAMIAGGVAWLLSGKDAKLPSFGSGGSESSGQGSYDPEHRDYLSYIGQVQPNDGEDHEAYQRRRDLARCNYFMVERNPGEDDTSLRQRLDDATESFRQKRSAFAEQARHAGEQVSAGASHAARQVSAGASQAVDRGQDLFEHNPWAGGLLAAAAGALAGTVLPLSRTEQEQLAGLGGKVRDMAGEQKDRLTSELRERKDDLVGNLRDKKDELVDKAEEKLSDSGQSGQQQGGQGQSGSGQGGNATPPVATSSPEPSLPVF